MSQKRLSGFTAALMVSTLGFVPISRADQTEVVATTAELGSPAESPLSSPTSPAAFDPQAHWDDRQQEVSVNSLAHPAQRSQGQPSTTKVGTSQSADQNSVQASTLVQVVPHAFDQYQAATLYLRGIPVLTFLDPTPRDPIAPTRKLPSSTKPQTTADEQGGSKASQPSADELSEQTTEDTDPVLRATSIAALLNYLHQSGLDASSIQVRWDEAGEVYQVYLEDSDLALAPPSAPLSSDETNGEAADRAPTLITIDDYTISPDTTGDLAEDALQVANRLRRLLGNAEPLATVERPSAPAYDVQQAGGIRQVIQGMASWYGPGFHGRLSANGEVYNQNALTAAHRSLPFGTQVRVTNLNTGQSVVVRINDRGPYVGNRVIDLSAAAARYIGMVNSGVAPVRLDILE
ncbi:MAG: septal ring lytic transglycosylase RlpA family protein [Prochlorothrix sp.]